MSLQPEATMPLVVACLTTWNAADFIEETLASLLGQTYPKLKILIFDDFSSDNTVDICRGMTVSDARVDIRVQSKNVGWIGNVNSLLDSAEGAYLFIAAHDDMLQFFATSGSGKAVYRGPGTSISGRGLLSIRYV